MMAMFRPLFSSFKKFDLALFGAALLLTLAGLAAIYSTSLGGTTTSLFGALGNFANFWKQLAFAGTGIAIALGCSFMNYRLFSRLARPLYFVAIVLLVAVLVFGSKIRGTTGWFAISGFGIQPVEFVKLALIIFLARFFSYSTRERSDIYRIIVSGAAVAILVGLVLMQPDFGSALLLLAIWGSLLFVSGVRRSYIIAMFMALLVVAVVGWFFLLKPYQKGRIAVFWDPMKDPRGKGYNVTQSVIAIGSGGLTGKGLGFGSQSQLRFLPERQTDFIFAVVAEELGFVGVVILITLFGILLHRGYSLAAGARDNFTLFLCLGIVTSIAVEAFVNLGGTLRLLPVTGVTLPFLSYGGSSLLVKFAMVGILESVAARR